MSESYGFQEGLAKFRVEPSVQEGRNEIFPGAEVGSNEDKANKIHLGLIEKITEVNKSISIQNIDEPIRTKVASHEEAMIGLLSRFANGELELERDEAVENRKSQSGDKVSFYRARFFNGLREYHANILIRPDDFISSVNPRDRAGQRISFELIPALSQGDAQGRSMVRMDNDFALEYDLEVNLPEHGNIIDKLDLTQLGQSGGHHFRSQEKISGSAEFAQVLGLFDEKARVQLVARKAA